MHFRPDRFSTIFKQNGGGMNIRRHMFRSKGTWRSNRRDHTKLQIVFMHTNVSTCDFLRFDANDKGDFEAQKLEKS